MWKSVLLSKFKGIPITEKGQKLAARTEFKVEALEKLSHTQTNGKLREA